jgi:3-deoxy-D-manno-octulosonate 8-phosphate phosphatase (KDO 8-P phosphatase)
MANYLDQLKNIRHFVFDVDGVLTDGKVLALESGEQARSFLVKDGYAIESALKAGYGISIISGGNQEGVFKRLSFLRISNIHLGVKDKVATFQLLCTEQQIDPKTVLYMGDDLPDFDVMQYVGLPTCPADAVPEIKEIAAYISHVNGGEGCVRDVIEKVMRAQQTWHKQQQVNINN